MSTYYKWVAEPFIEVAGARFGIINGSIQVNFQDMRWQRAPEKLKDNVTDETFTLRKKQKYRIVYGNNLYWFKDVSALSLYSVYWRNAIFDRCGRRGVIMEAVK